MPFLSFGVQKKSPFQLCWDHMTGFWDAFNHICRYRTDHKTLFKCPHCHYCFSNLRDHVFQIIASQDGRNLNCHTTALRIYVRDLVNSMAHTKRCQGTNYIGEGRLYRQQWRTMQACPQWGDMPTPSPDEENEGNKFQNPGRMLYRECYLIGEFLFKRSTLPSKRTLQKYSNLIPPPIFQSSSVLSCIG